MAMNPGDVWAAVRTRIANIIQSVNHVTSRVYRETPGGIDVRRMPLSIFDGLYSVEFRGFPRVGMEVNTMQEIDVTVRLNVAYLFNLAERYDSNATPPGVVNDKGEYNNAVNDLLRIINAVMVSQEFEDVEFIGTGPFEFMEENDNFAVVGIDFTLSTTVTP